ncbi:AAA family ATPase [bacterium]|nr:AAA family ATPase [bacterium]
MIHRISKLSKSNSFFLFGARGVGKSSLIENFFKSQKNVLKVDLLKSEWEDELIKNPDYLIESVEKHRSRLEWVVIDEIQKIPKLLDTVHYLIENKKIKFALTGSSARKLKRGAANLLAGRAFSFELFPLTHLEMGDDFDLEKNLRYGGLPALTEFSNESDKHQYLKSYVSTYLKEEIQAEQIVRNLKPFRLFLDVAAQMNAKIINFSKIANDVGADTKSVQNYFEILRDTHVGLLLNSHEHSLRKRQKKNPKFYYFDTGVVRSLNRQLNRPLQKGTFEYGDLFEQFIILEMHRLNSYFSLDYQFSYLQTNNNLEIDVVIERPGLPTAFVEIKSAEKFKEDQLSSLRSLKKDYPKNSYYFISNDKRDAVVDGINILPWKKGLIELGFVR